MRGVGCSNLTVCPWHVVLCHDRTACAGRVAVIEAAIFVTDNAYVIGVCLGIGTCLFLLVALILNTEGEVKDKE